MRRSLTLVAAVALGAIVTSLVIRPSVSGQANAEIPRTADGKPDLTGVWQVLSSAAWGIQDHSPRLGVAAGQGVVEGNEISYQPWALEQKEENYALAVMGNPYTEITADPISRCYMPGVPRATYMPYP